MSDQDKPYKVGKGKPPKHTQFKPNVSGNPKGRPKGRMSINAAIEKILQGNHKIAIDGKIQEVTGSEAIAMLIFKQAIAKEQKALECLLKADTELQSKADFENRPLGPDWEMEKMIEEWDEKRRQNYEMLRIIRESDE